ncbi:acyl CoA:acetate/3-ketoacid CoA transferase [Chloroflexota bacterium]
MSAEKAIELIKDEDSLAISGFITCGVPEELLIALEKRFLDTGHPRDLTTIHTGDPGNNRGFGLDHLSYEGLLKKTIGSHFNLNPKLQNLIVEEKIEGYVIPLGVLSRINREIAAGNPGVITHIGLNTVVDPRVAGPEANLRSKEKVVEVLQFNGREWLLYKSFPIDVALIRGTTVDELGNLSMEKEALDFDVLALALAAKNCGGKVIVQAEQIATARSLNPRDVKLPGAFVDAIVIGQPENHWQTFREQYNPAYSGEIHSSLISLQPAPFSFRKIIGRRGAMELRQGTIVNLGIGMAEFVGEVAGEERIADQLTFLIEAGSVGGIPAYGLNFGASFNPDSIIDTAQMIDFIDGSGLDMCFVGFAEIDELGNVNVSKVGNRLAGVGGFIDITQSTHKVVFCGAFTATYQEDGIKVGNGKIEIAEDGNTKKFVKRVQQITFSAADALERDHEVTYVTERAVFKLTKEGLVLTEIAPGVNLDKDILGQMEFKPIIAKNLKEMPKKIFKEGQINLRHKFQRT